MGIFTGDFVFVGSIGRPDLLEEAAGIKGSAEAGAHQLYHSAERFKHLPDYLQVWPAHGAGSACGKGLGAIPSSTVGYEKRLNPALQYNDETAFVQYILSDQPEAPKYFAVMKRVNKEGPGIIGKAGLPEFLDSDRIGKIRNQATILDLSPSKEFSQAHVPGTLNIPLSMLAGWAGWLVDYSRPVYVITEPAELAETVRVLQKIGIDEQLQGAFRRAEILADGLATENYPVASAAELAPRIEANEVHLIDVRTDAEWNLSHIPQAEHRFLGRLPEQLTEIEHSKPVVVQCQSSARSAIAASILQADGMDVINLSGGFQAWLAAGYSSTSMGQDQVTCSPGSKKACSLEK